MDVHAACGSCASQVSFWYVVYVDGRNHTLCRSCYAWTQYVFALQGETLITIPN